MRLNYCHLLITLANSSDPDQARRIVGPDQGPKCLNSDGIPGRILFKKLILKKKKFKKNQQTKKKHEK